MRSTEAVAADPYEGLPSLGETIAVVNGQVPGVVTPLADRSGVPAGTMLGSLLSRSRLRALPSLAPLIEDTLDLGTVAVLAGYTGTMKSFVALDWAASVATGHAWRGRASVRRRSLFIAAEGAYGLDNRLVAWEATRGVEVADDDFSVLPLAVHLGRHGDVAELAALIDSEAFGLVVVDTLAKCITGMDENSAQDMGRAVAALYALQGATNGGTVIAVHHTGKDRTTIRGSSALESGVDSVYTTEGDSRSLKLARTKRKDGPCDDIHTLAFQPVEGTESGVVMSVGGADMAGRARDLMSVFLSAFSTTGATKSDLRAAADMAPATFARSLNSLVSLGQLANVGTDQRPFYKAVT